MLITTGVYKTGVERIAVNVPGMGGEEPYTDEPSTIILHKQMGVITADGQYIVAHCPGCRVTVEFRNAEFTAMMMKQLSEEVTR
jgi:hypothetical protein